MHHHRFSQYFRFLDSPDSKQARAESSLTGKEQVKTNSGAEEQQIPSETLSVIKEAANRQWRRLQESGVETTKLMELAASILKSCGSEDINQSLNSFQEETDMKEDCSQVAWQEREPSESNWENSSEVDCDDAVWCDEAWADVTNLWSGHSDDGKSADYWCHDEEFAATEKSAESSAVSTGGTINLRPNTNEPLIVSMEGFFRFSFEFSEALNDVVEEYSAAKQNLA